MSSRTLLTFLILAGLVLGAVVGNVVYGKSVDDPEMGASFARVCNFVGGDIFMGLLKMLIVPLIISSVIVGVTSVGDFRHLGAIGLKTLAYYFGTMAIAVVIGLVVVNVIKPGVGFFSGPDGEANKAKYLADGKEKRAEIDTKQEKAGAEVKSSVDAALNIVRQMIPKNPVAAAADFKPLQLIVFSILFGIVLTTIGPQKRVLVDVFRAIMQVMIKMTGGVLWFAPIGVFCLVGRSVGSVGLGIFLEKIGAYMATVLISLGIHAFVVLPGLVFLLGHANPFLFLWQMRAALLMALSTASSSATLPVTMEAADKAGCSKRASGFVLPLGSTINMDGTALYEAVAVVFMAQAFSPVPLEMGQMVLIAITATLAAVGAAGIPEAGLTTMLIVVTAVNTGGAAHIPPEAIGLILGVDRILDMCRTSINVWGDAVGAKIITRTEPDPSDEPPSGAPK